LEFTKNIALDGFVKLVFERREMMKNDVKLFQEAMERDSKLKEEVKKLRSKYDKDILNSMETYTFLTEDLLPFARAKGYNFSINDYLQYELEIERRNSGNNDLKNIYGGVKVPSGEKFAICGAMEITSMLDSDKAGFKITSNREEKKKNFFQTPDKNNYFKSDDSNDDSLRSW
jgi:hypothetical protein